jgi:radical SAM superfamily enzyme YgiQ (UPF0313 family)
MNIGLVFPNKDRRYKTIHLGLAYLAAYAREKHDDLSFQVLDTRVATTRETKRFFNSKFDLIGITVFSPVYSEVIKIFDKIRKIQPRVPVCLGGPYVTTIREEIFKKTPADFAVCGEGERTFAELISCLKGQGELADVDGLLYKNGKGSITVNPEREKIKDLDSLPMPAYDIFPMKKYPLHRMITARGCPYSCAWCNSSSIWDHTNRMISPEKIIEEVEFLINTYGKKIFVIGDNSFNTNLERVEAFCDLLIAKKINILWAVNLRADNMTQEIACKMKSAGCYNASVGIESANNFVLEKIGKGSTIEKMAEGIKMLKNAGIEIMSQYVMGSPYDTLEHIKESIEFARQINCDYTNFYAILPYKGTPQWEYIKEHGTFFSEEIHDYHSMEPRIVFETPEFGYEDRLTAIKLVKKHGFYSNQDKKNWMFDLAKETGRKIQNLLPEKMGKELYMLLKSVYRLKMIKKHNQ